MTNVSLSNRPSQAHLAAFPSLRLHWIAAGAAMVLVQIVPALWNGFPLIFSDTGGYLERPISGTLNLGRSALYGLFLYAGVQFDFWLNVVLQAALAAWLFVLTMRAERLGRPWLAFGIIAVLSVTTSLPWFASQLMPDILFPCAVLALYLLAFRDSELAAWERAGLIATIAVAIASHMAAAALCVGLIAALWLIARLSSHALPEPRLVLAGVAVAGGLVLSPVSNYVITGHFAFTPGGSSFLFARILEDGIVHRYLKDQCPDETLRLCAYQATLTEDADEWLWRKVPFYTLGGWENYSAEERAIIAATLKRYPLMHAHTAIAGALYQLGTFETEVSMKDNEPTYGTFIDRAPHLTQRFFAARQQAEKFDVSPLNLLHVPVAAFAMAALTGTLMLRRKLKLAPERAALDLTVLLALVVNAMICGVFSHAVDRYQSRLMPLASFAVALLIARRKLSPG